MNKFQIIVPTLNSYFLLSKLIKSLKSQTWKNWKVIFIDGDSDYKHIKWLKSQCKKDKRFIYIHQRDKKKGIFGAMNQGIESIDKNNWILFWGSDDWVFDKNIFEKLNKKIKNNFLEELDMIICRGQYINTLKKLSSRKTFFINNKKDFYLEKDEYRKLLFLGYTPPHQATLINPKLFLSGTQYNEKLKIAADLDFFCNVSKLNKLKLAIFNFNLVKISSGGISAKYTSKRLKEVIHCYIKHFGVLFFIPLILRYVNKISQKLW